MKNSNEKKIVAFHIGRGGRFKNSGYLTFIGENEIGNYIDELFINDNLVYVDGSGNSVGLTDNDVKNGIGTIDIDGAYDTTYTKLLSECDDREIEAIRNSSEWNKDELLELLGENY
jgi:hypothetical protein